MTSSKKCIKLAKDENVLRGDIGKKRKLLRNTRSKRKRTEIKKDLTRLEKKRKTIENKQYKSKCLSTPLRKSQSHKKIKPVNPKKYEKRIPSQYEKKCKTAIPNCRNSLPNSTDVLKLCFTMEDKGLNFDTCREFSSQLKDFECNNLL